MIINKHQLHKPFYLTNNPINIIYKAIKVDKDTLVSIDPIEVKIGEARAYCNEKRDANVGICYWLMLQIKLLILDLFSITAYSLSINLDQ